MRLSPKIWSLERDEQGRLILVDADREKKTCVDPVRAFPLTEPRCFISLRDQYGEELVWIGNLDEIPEEERCLIEAELMQREFIPVVQKIYRLICDVPPLVWEVETDRGRTQFLVNSEDNIRRLGPHRLLVVDSNGIRYQIGDYSKLDASSRRHLERVL